MIKNFASYHVLARRDDVRTLLARWLSIKRLNISEFDSWLKEELKKDLKDSNFPESAVDDLVKKTFEP